METFEFVTKKRKRRNRWMTVSLSVLAISGLYIGARMITGKVISNQAWKVVHEVELVESVAFPNIKAYTWSANGGDMFNGGIKGRQAKDIYGIPVDYGEYKTDFNILSIRWGKLFESTTGKQTEAGATINIENNQKVSHFYNVKLTAGQPGTQGGKSSEPTNEIKYTKDMKNQLVEVAITFDKPYSLKELQTMIPKNLKTNWYWIGTYSKGDPSWWEPSNLYGTSPENLTRKEFVHKKEAEEAVAKLKEGEKLDKRLSEMKDVDGFLANLKKYMESDRSSTYNGFKTQDDIKVYLKKFGNLDLSKKEELDKLEFAGIILTGKSEDFAKLENQSWIYASSIGASIPNQPYYHLENGLENE
ncbi:anti-sigma factor C-terminal domain-containing protein [Streptococcus gallolyticus]|nr:anti-sigma factor C-terminal domain-containing protein [Streptococcus gallolyticus]MBY5041679.1 anti-sigma factor C-terminal domain-containing protein [Streptococcus gallolyticus]